MPLTEIISLLDQKESLIYKVESKLPYPPEDISEEYNMEGLVPGIPEFFNELSKNSLRLLGERNYEDKVK